MAKKRKRPNVGQGPPPKPSPPWSAEEMATLYGWLDYCVQVLGYNKEDFFSTVTVKLEDQGSTRHDVKLVKAKLKRDHESYGREGTNMDDVFRHGGSDLIGFSDQEKKKIATAKQTFIDETITATPARRLRRDRSSNQLRSMSHTPAQSLKKESPGLIKRENRMHGSPSLKTYGKDRKKDVVRKHREPESVMKQSKLPAHVESLRSNLKSEFDPPQQSSRRSLKLRIIHPSTVSVVEDSEDSEDESSVPRLLPSINDHGAAEEIKQDDLDESMPKVSRKLSPAFERHSRCIPDCLFTEHVSGIKPGEIMCINCGNWQHYACVGFDIRNTEMPSREHQPFHCSECNPVSHQETENARRASNVIDGLRHKLDTAVVEIKDLKENLSQREKDFEEYREEARRVEDVSRHHKSIQDRIDHIYQGSNSHQSVESLLQQREEHIKGLEKKLSDIRNLSRFTKLSHECREAFGLEIGSYEGISKVYKTSKQFSLQFEPPIQQFLVPNLDGHPGLKLLVYEGLRHEKDEEESFLPLSKLNTQELLRYLITSALSLWVFNTDFPKLVSGEDDIFMKYRGCILQQDGPNTVRNLDLACYHSLIRGKYFHERYIRPEAQNLVIRFSQTLAPLFSATPNSATESNWDEFSTWGEDSEKWSDRRSWLSELFLQALELKAESCLNTDDYEMIIYKPGTNYDENTMSVETEDGMAVLSGLHSERVVKICLEAAVFSFARKEVSGETGLESMILSSNFVHRNKEQRATSHVLVRAVVVLVSD